MLEPLLEGSDMFIVSLKVKPANNIKVYLDADSGLSIGKCATVNRKLYGLIEEEGLYPDGDFSLEISSPGIDEPLTGIRQYKKNIGRTLLVTPVEGPEQLGILKSVEEDHLILEVKVPKKEPVLVEIPFSGIKTAVVQIVF